MPDFENIRSRQYRPDPEKCCSACVFGEGEHADWCVVDLSGERPPFPFGPPEFVLSRGGNYRRFSRREIERQNLLAAMGSDL